MKDSFETWGDICQGEWLEKVRFSFSINIWQENPSQCWDKSQLCHNGLLQKLKWDLKVKSYGKRDGLPGRGRCPL